MEEALVSPVGQLGEEEVRGEASSQPGEAAQERDPRQAGDGVPRFGFRNVSMCDRKPDNRHGNEEDEE